MKLIQARCDALRTATDKHESRMQSINNSTSDHVFHLQDTAELLKGLSCLMSFVGDYEMSSKLGEEKTKMLKAIALLSEASEALQDLRSDELIATVRDLLHTSEFGG